jgi:alanine dehydrogenase
MVALASPGASELPPKIGIHPRPAGSFVHAMPAHLRATDPRDDLVGMKWVAGFSANNERGLPAIHALVVLNDPETGLPTAILDGGPITAQRTAAVSGVAIRILGPGAPLGGSAGGSAGTPAGASAGARLVAPRVALIGAGVQGRAHLPVIGHVLPGARLRLFDRHHERAEALADASRETPGVAEATVHADPREAVADADVVITAASFAPPPERQVMTVDWLAEDVLVVAVDYATYCAADVAAEAAAQGTFLVDDRGQFVANRDAGNFDGYPDPSDTIGGAMLAGRGHAPAIRGRRLVTHLGVGLADLVMADAIVRGADRLGLGVDLAR